MASEARSPAGGRPRQASSPCHYRRVRSAGRARPARPRFPTRWRAGPMRRASRGSSRAVPTRCAARAARRIDRRAPAAAGPPHARPRSGRVLDRGAGEPSSRRIRVRRREVSQAPWRRERPAVGPAEPPRASRRRRAFWPPGGPSEACRVAPHRQRSRQPARDPPRASHGRGDRARQTISGLARASARAPTGSPANSVRRTASRRPS